jgi:hypothetical protein
MAVFFVYIDLLNAPDACQWWGPHGTISSIATTLGIPNTRRQVVRRVLNTEHGQAEHGIIYDGERRSSNREVSLMIAPDSFVPQIIGDAMEGGFCLHHMQELVNKHQ